MKSNYVVRRAKSFGDAFAGIWFLVRTEPNARVHAVATVAVVAAGIWWKVTATDWCWLVAAMGMVWTAEAINTAIENVCDVVHPGEHVGIKRAKDVAAGGVLVSALAAAVIGGIVFGVRVLGR